jgi:hypothetical protein
VGRDNQLLHLCSSAFGSLRSIRRSIFGELPSHSVLAAYSCNVVLDFRQNLYTIGFACTCGLGAEFANAVSEATRSPTLECGKISPPYIRNLLYCGDERSMCAPKKLIGDDGWTGKGLPEVVERVLSRAVRLQNHPRRGGWKDHRSLIREPQTR